MPYTATASMSASTKRRLLTNCSRGNCGYSLSMNSNKKGTKLENTSSDIIEYARLTTTNKAGGSEAIVLCPDMPVVIGRNPRLCSYTIDNRLVSNVHCKFYAVLSSNGGVIVSCQDTSTNGLIVNGYKLRKTAAIVMDGDEIEIPFAKKFKCVHILKDRVERTDIFEPTPPQGACKNLTVGRYTIMSHCLGSGSFASVHLAFDTTSQKQVACKTIVARGKERKDMQGIMKEVNILRGLQHPNINRVLDMEVNEKNGWLHIFLELCTGGDLFTYISSRQRLREGEAKYVMYQLLKGIEYLHDRHISHRDLKPENIMLFMPGPYPRIQIADFGLAREKAYQETRNVCGTVAYLPPEGVLALDRRELGYLGMPSDCWSAGVLLYIMLSGGHPFDYQECDEQSCASQLSQDRLSQFSQGSIVSEQVVKKRIVNGHIDFTDEIWNALPDAKRLIGRLMVYDHKYRETVYGALKSSWIIADLKDLEDAYKERVCSSGIPS